MEFSQFISEYRLFRQKVGEELGIKDDEMVLKFFIAYKNLQRIENRSSDVLKNVMEMFNLSTFKYPNSNNPDSEDNDDDPFSSGIPF